MLEKSRELAIARATAVTQTATGKMQALLRGEAERLRDLQRVNDHIRDEEIAIVTAQMDDLTERLGEAPLRLDSVRLILRTPAA